MTLTKIKGHFSLISLEPQRKSYGQIRAIFLSERISNVDEEQPPNKQNWLKELE